MLNKKRIRGEMIAKGYTQETLAKAMGMSPKTFYNRMSKGYFKTDEAEKMIRILELKEPVLVFFDGFGA